MEATHDQTVISSLVDEVASLGKQIKEGTIDEKSRQLLQKRAEELSYALETPGDTVQRVAYLVSFGACLVNRLADATSLSGQRAFEQP